MAAVKVNNKQAAEKITVEKLRLMTTHRFFASILLHLKFVESEDPESTMGVNAHGTCTYNPDWVMQLSGNDLRFVLCHELMHVILRHCYRYPMDLESPQLWNIAVDAVVNDTLLNQEGFMVSDALEHLMIRPDSSGIYEFKYSSENKSGEKIAHIKVRDKTAESIYYELLRLLRQENKKSNGKGKTEANGGYRAIGQGFDQHQLGDQEEQEDSNKSSSKGSPAIKDFSEDDAKNLDNKWEAAVASANMEDPTNARGSGNGWLSRLLDAFAKPQLNWRALLRRHIKETIPYDSTYKRPKKRAYSTGVYMPVIYCKPHIITVAVDISGSISAKELKTFITEVYGITRAYNNVDIRVLFWSTQVDAKNDVKYKPNKIRDILDVKAYTTGGTEISCVEDYIIDHDMKESSIIYLTDGFVESNPYFKCRQKKRLFIIQKEGETSILEKYGPVAKLKE